MIALLLWLMMTRRLSPEPTHTFDHRKGSARADSMSWEKIIINSINLFGADLYAIFFWLWREAAARRDHFSTSIKCHLANAGGLSRVISHDFVQLHMTRLSSECARERSRENWHWHLMYANIIGCSLLAKFAGNIWNSFATTCDVWVSISWALYFVIWVFLAAILIFPARPQWNARCMLTYEKTKWIIKKTFFCCMFVSIQIPSLPEEESHSAHTHFVCNNSHIFDTCRVNGNKFQDELWLIDMSISTKPFPCLICCSFSIIVGQTTSLFIADFPFSPFREKRCLIYDLLTLFRRKRYPSAD